MPVTNYISLTPYTQQTFFAASLLRVGLLVAALLVTASTVSAEEPMSPVQPVELSCDGLINPLGVSTTPKLGWRLDAGSQRAVRSTAWQIVAASQRDLLQDDKGDLWDSGKVAAARLPTIRYGGKPLTAGMQVFWKVRCWDAGDKVTPWSAGAVFDVAPTTPADWQGARWINDGKDNPTEDADFYKPDPAPLMRREFTLAKPITRARLHVAGLGLCYPSVNGQRVVDHVFDPPWTNFDKRILFRSHDVTAMLHEGANCLGLALGNGWYNPLPLRMWGRRNIRGSLPVGRPRAIAYLVVEHPDGTSTTLTTDGSWKTAPGRTIRNSIYLGEVRDARNDIADWDKPGFAETDWQPVRLTDDSLEPLQPLVMPPVRLGAALPAQAVTEPEPSVYIIDFGKNLTGIPDIMLEAPAGTEITFRYGELLYDDGKLNPMTGVCGQIKTPADKPKSNGGPGAPMVAWQTDTYIARGGGPEQFRPDFTFHAFRFMEVRGLPSAPKVGDAQLFPFNSDLASAGTFSCSNDLLNQIQDICHRTFLSNAVTVQSDCPHRERFGYGGDIVATSETYMMNFDMAGFYSKTVRDWADGVRPDGRLTDTAPFVGIDYCGVGWAMVHPLLLEQLYQHYGLRDLVVEQLPIATTWFDVEAARRKDNLVVRGLGDHESLVPGKGPQLTTAVFIDTALRLARLAKVVGDEAKVAHFTKYAEESSIAWSKAFLDPATGKVGEGHQPELCFALGFNAAPAASRDQVFAQLVTNLTTPEDGPRLATGIYGTRILLEELSQHGRSDLAYALATRKTFPSLGWMLENDATSLWEHWAKDNNTYSHNHSMFGSVSGWFFRWLGGIQCAEDAIGFDRIVIRPQIVDGLTWVKTSHTSVRGMIVSEWKIDDNGRHVHIVIPPNTEAKVMLPIDGGTVTEGGKPLTEAPGVTFIAAGDPSQLHVGSGDYHFRITK